MQTPLFRRSQSGSFDSESVAAVTDSVKLRQLLFNKPWDSLCLRSEMFPLLQTVTFWVHFYWVLPSVERKLKLVGLWWTCRVPFWRFPQSGSLRALWGREILCTKKIAVFNKTYYNNIIIISKIHFPFPFPFHVIHLIHFLSSHKLTVKFTSVIIEIHQDLVTLHIHCWELQESRRRSSCVF